MGGHSAGVVLTGGASRRMGVDKALVEVDGRPMAVRVADALWEAGCRPVVCQGGDVEALTALGLEAHPDDEEHAGAGPVAAIVAASTRLGGAIVVAACDLADLDPATVERVVAAGATVPPRVTVAEADGRRHLLSYWPAGSLVAVAAVEAPGGTVGGRYEELLARVGAVGVPVEAAAVRNVNTPDDLDRGG
jgi:molybdopterin-guanine dinucleotide biosynthesis protein A